MITPMDPWRTKFRIIAWSTLTSEIITIELDEYEEVLVQDDCG